MRLGAILTTCLLTVGLAAQPQPGWVDPSPHKQRLVRVDPDASIEVLDWGGSGRALVLLAQLGQTAHIYDDWAPALAGTYHVLGITRRGHGESSAPPAGYSAERLATDIIAALDAEHVRDPVLVGNGFAGEEMFWIGARFPNRVAGLVFLDAAYDRTNVSLEGAIARRIPPRQPRPQDLESARALTQWVAEGIGFPIPESEIRQMAQLTEDGRIAGERTPAAIRQQILAGMVKADYSNIRVPVLGIYAKPTSADSFPGCRGADAAAVRQACGELYAWSLQHLSESERLLRTIGAGVQVVELPGANRFVFLSNEREVTRAMSQFVSALTAGSVTASAAQRPQVESDQQVLITLERGWNDAFYRKDVAFIQNILADEFIATYDDGSRGDKAKELALAADFSQQVESAIQDEFTVKVYGDTAVVWFTLRLVGIRQGQRADLSLRYTDVWVMRDGRWRCVSTHSTRVNPK